MGAINVQGRIDMKSLATIARAYIDRGVLFTSRSDLMGRIVEDASIAAERMGVERPETDEAAFQYLQSVGINLVASDRGRREVRRVLIKDTGVHDFYGEDLMARRTTKGSLATTSGSIWENEREAYDTAAAAMRQMGLKPISFEEFVAEGRRKKAATAGGQSCDDATLDSERVDVAAFEEKERERLAAERAAFSPEALRQAAHPATT